MNTKKGLLVLTMLTVVQPSVRADWQELWTKAVENPQQSITTILGGMAFVTTAIREVRKFLKTPEAKQAKYDSYIDSFLESHGIATNESLEGKYVTQEEFEDVVTKDQLRDYVTRDQFSHALMDYFRNSDAAVNFVAKDELESYVTERQFTSALNECVKGGETANFVTLDHLQETQETYVKKQKTLNKTVGDLILKLDSLTIVTSDQAKQFMKLGDLTPETHPWIATKAYVTEKVNELETKLSN